METKLEVTLQETKVKTKLKDKMTKIIQKNNSIFGGYALNKEQIDKLWEVLENWESLGESNAYKVLFSIIGRENEYEDYESKSDEEKGTIYENILKTIMVEIDNGDFEYLKSKIRSSNKDMRDSFLFGLLPYSEHYKEYVKELIEGTAQLKTELTTADITRLITEIDAEDSLHSYTKACIEGKINLAVELDNADIVKLLRSIDDWEFAKEIILQRRELILQLYSNEVKRLDDPILTEFYIRNMKDNIDSYQLADLVKSTGNTVLIREALDGTLGIELSTLYISILLKGENELTKEVIEGKLKTRDRTR